MNCYNLMDSPLGELLLVADESHLLGVYFVGQKYAPDCGGWREERGHPVLRQAERELSEYFKGRRQEFTLPIRFQGTAFQQRVWEQIAKIPFGQTITYSELASRTGSIQAVRAAGTATGRNPISVVVPCHRVMGKDGSMHGYAGGLERKRGLLEIEGHLA